jgi:hypothetical protein
VSKNLPPEIKKKLKEMKGEVESIEDLSSVLHILFREYGKTLTDNWMIFVFGGKESLLIKCDAELWGMIKILKETVSNGNLNMLDVMKSLVGEYIGAGKKG